MLCLDGLRNPPQASHKFKREDWNIALQNSAFTCVAVRSCSASIFASATSLSNGRGVPVCSVPPYPRSLSAIRPHSPLSLFTLSRSLSVYPLYCRLVAHRPANLPLCDPIFVRVHPRFPPTPKTTVGASRCFGMPPQSSVNDIREERNCPSAQRLKSALAGENCSWGFKKNFEIQPE